MRQKGSAESESPSNERLRLQNPDSGGLRLPTPHSW